MIASPERTSAEIPVVARAWQAVGCFGRAVTPVVLLMLLASPCWGLDKVSLQLKWRHQFQFAGYYAALAQGFYGAAGLNVEIREVARTSTAPRKSRTAGPISASARPTCCLRRAIGRSSRCLE
jgi:hypothetical protein